MDIVSSRNSNSNCPFPLAPFFHEVLNWMFSVTRTHFRELVPQISLVKRKFRIKSLIVAFVDVYDNDVQPRQSSYIHYHSFVQVPLSLYSNFPGSLFLQASFWKNFIKQIKIFFPKFVQKFRLYLIVVLELYILIQHC